MQGFKQLIKNSKKQAGLVLLLILSGFSAAYSQPTTPTVSITVNILPPYSPYYSDYSGANASKVLLILRNLTATTKNVKIAGTVTGNNGIRITTKSTFMPLQPIVLQPNEVKQLTGLALRDIFDLNTLNVYGIDKVKLVKTSRLPEGNYTFCLQAKDYTSSAILSLDGCTSFEITYPPAPVLIAPAPYSKELSRTPQNVVFNWINAGNVPANTQYIIQVAEMPNGSLDPNQVLNATTVPLLSQRVLGFSYTYGVSNVPLKVGSKYAWRVIASDPTGRSGFMNDGKSNANMFIYGSTEQLAALNPALIVNSELLNIITPNCKRASDQLIVGTNVNLKLNWLWKEQIESISLFGSLDSNLLKRYTRVNVTPVNPAADTKSKSNSGLAALKTPDVYETIKYYKLEIVRQGGNSDAKKYINHVVYAPDQELELTKKQADSIGLVAGQTYVLNVFAIGENQKIIRQATSCPWILKGEVPAARPKLTIKGKVNYSFDNAAYYGANKAAISLQFVENKTDKPNVMRFKYHSKGYSLQPIIYTTTDADGNFSVEIDQLDTDTGKKFLAIAINSPYYKPLAEALTVNVPKISSVSEGNSVRFEQDKLVLSAINTGAYNYTVTVNMGKLFDVLYSNVKDANGVAINNINITETNFINSTARVEAGLLVGIYRKAKKDDVPKNEGDFTSKNALYPLQNGYTRVAEGRTIIKDGKTIVVFDKLLLSWYYGDEYYIKALLPKTTPGSLPGESEADLSAPEQRLAFFPPKFDYNQLQYATSIDYKLVSKKPPMAKIKGKIMQQWPSTPGVLHPYANKPFTVKLRNANSFAETDLAKLMKGPDPCQYYPHVIKQKVKGPNGQITYTDVPGASHDYSTIVATGVTDKDGNYEIQIFDYMEMRDYDLELQRTSDIPEGKTCAELAAEKSKADAKALEDKSKTGNAAFVNGWSADMIEKQIRENGMVTGKGMGGEFSAGGGGYVDNMAETFPIGTSAQSLIDKYTPKGGGGPPKPGFDPSGGSVNALLNGEIANVAEKLNKFGNVATYRNFVDDENTFGLPDDPLALLEKEENYQASLRESFPGTLSRYFYIEGITPVSTINNDPGQSLQKFQVQPFGSVNLGVSILNIDEVTNLKVNVSVKDVTDNQALNGAKLVVFRTSYSRPAAGVYPVGEGSPQHPIKNLINANYSPNSPKYEVITGTGYYNPKTGQYESYQKANDGTYNVPVEWVLEEPLSIQLGAGNKGSFDLSNRRLWKNGAYYILITPNPEGTGGRFEPFVVSVSPKALVKEIEVRISPSRISGRVLDKSSGKAISNGTVTLQVYEQGSITPETTILPTTVNGYYEITNGAYNNYSWENNAHFRAYSEPTGYSNPPPMRVMKVETANAFMPISKAGNNYDFPILKTPAATLLVNIFGEQQNESAIFLPIRAYLKRSDGTIFTDAERKAGIPVLSGNTQIITIIPEDPAYFQEEISIPAVVPSSISRNIKRLKHRMRFVLKEANGQLAAAGAVRITINNNEKLSRLNLASGTSFEFENVSVNNYTVQIAPASGSGYIPKIVEITNQESKDQIIYEMVLTKGSMVSGTVKLDGLAAVKAKVYIDYSASQAIPKTYDGGSMVNNTLTNSAKTDVAALETVTNDVGYYEIKGLPFIENESVKIHVTYSGNVMVNGAEKTVKIISNAAKADFTLNKFNGPIVNTLYGFPLNVERIERWGNENKVVVTGIVDLGKNSSSFASINPDTKIRVSNVIFDYTVDGQPQVPVKLDALTALKMTYLEKYNVKIENLDAAGNKLPLTLEKFNKGGALNGQVSITDNSFKFPTSYLNFPDNNGFYLSTIAGEKAKNVTRIKAIYSTPFENTVYYLSDRAGDPLKFSFAGFQGTTADAKKSYIGTDKRIHLSVNIKGKVPNALPGEVDLNIKDLQLDGNAIYVTKGAEALKLKLQTWDLEVNDWEFDIKKGGIVSNAAVIRTGIVDVPVKTFNLRSDLFVLKNFDVSKITLGNGLLNLTSVDTTNFHLVYDEATGSDQSAHWRFSGAPSKFSYVAKIPLPAVPNKFPATTLNVNYFQFISYNNENLISLSGGQTGLPLYGNPKFVFYPSSVSSNLGSFFIGGQAAIALPRVNNVTLNLRFDKGSGAAFDMTPMNFDLNFEGKGYVKYQNLTSEPIVSTGGVTFIKGTVVEPGKINPINSTLSFGQGNDGKILLEKDFALNLDGLNAPDKSKNLHLILSGNTDLNGMKVENKDWTTLKFSGELNDPKSGQLVPKKPIYNFEVLGEIQANAQKLEVDKIATPLGDVKMSYNFSTKRMTGSLSMKDVAFGAYKFTGDVEIGYGGTEGFLMLGAGQLNTGTLFKDGFGTFNIGMLFSNATLSENSISKVVQYSKAKENYCWLKENRDKFQGFFITGGYDIVNEHHGFDIGIASIYLNAVLGVEASVGANFNRPSFQALIGAHGEVTAGMSAITGTSIQGGLHANITAVAAYDPTGFSITGSAGILVTYKVSQYLVAKTVTFDGSQEAKVGFTLQKGSSNFKFSLGKGSGASGCPPVN